MHKIEIWTVGKHQERWLEEELSILEKRLKGSMEFTWRLFKTDKELEEALLDDPHFTLLDERGALMTSKDFSKYVMQELRMRFVIGGSSGVSPKIRSLAAKTISFSLLTFTHQHMRLLLMEQIYRAFTIAKGTPYHK